MGLYPTTSVVGTLDWGLEVKSNRAQEGDVARILQETSAMNERVSAVGKYYKVGR